MARIRDTNTDFSTTSWDFLSKFIQGVEKEVGDNLNVGLEKATDHLADELEKATPVNKDVEAKTRGTTKRSWVKQMKYRNVKYINNTATNKQGIPIVNILEFSKNRGNPFVGKTLRANRDKIREIIVSEIEKGGAK